MLQNIFSIKIHDTHNFGVNSTTFNYTEMFFSYLLPYWIYVFTQHIFFTVTVHSGIALTVKDGTCNAVLFGQDKASCLAFRKVLVQGLCLCFPKILLE